MSERSKLELIAERDATLLVVAKSAALLKELHGMELESWYVPKAVEHMRWTTKRLSKHAFKLACEIGPQS